MGVVQGTLGPLLMGVTQQPDQLRLFGQVSEQINMVSDLTDGLSSRPSTRKVVSLGGDSDTKFADVQLEGTRYVISYGDNYLKVHDVLGTEYAVTKGSHGGYISTDMRFTVYDDEILVLNRDTVVSKDMSTDGYPFHSCVLFSLGGNFSRTYSVKLTFNGGTVVSVAYTTPDGTTDGDAAKSASDYIIKKLKEALDNETLPSGTTVQRKGDVLSVSHSQPIAVELVDGDGGTILRAITDTCVDATHLPDTARHGTIVKVVGDVADEDDYWLRFNSDTTNTIGSGFGSTGVWQEWHNPEQPTEFNSNTMPHRLYKSGNSFILDTVEWEPRWTGDDKSNPFPDIVGRAIRDLSGFESRLCMVAGPVVVFSETDSYNNLFRLSATTVVGSDPISMESTKEGTVSLDWIVPFDRNLIILSDPGDNQFVVTGGGLTPSNASTVLTTSYEMYGYCKPVNTGRTLMFPFKNGAYSGIKEFFTNDQVATNGADTITDGQSKYIEGTVSVMASSKNYDIVAFITDKQDNVIYVYKHLWDGNKRVQSSWSKWVLPDTTRYLFFDNNDMYIVTGEAPRLVKADLNKVPDPEGWHVTMDDMYMLTVPENRIVSLDEDELVVQSTGCLNPGVRAVFDRLTTDSVLLDETCPSGSTVYVGKRVTCSVKPTMPSVRDNDGRIISRAKVHLTRFFIYLDNSSDVEAAMECRYRSEPMVFYPRRFPMEDDPTGTNSDLTADYMFDVPWGERSDRSELVITARDVRPTSILEVEWEAQILGSKRRV